MAKHKEPTTPLYEKFALSVEANPQNYSKTIIQLVARYRKDQKRKDIYFDAAEAEKHINFISLMPLIDNEFANKLIPLQEWQAFLFANIYGWKKPNGTRKYRRVYLQIARKNSKTTISAMLAIDNAIMDPQPGGQILFAATTREQAELCFTMAKRMSEAMRTMYKSFAKICSTYVGSIEFTDTFTILKPVASDPQGTEGMGAKMAVIDEVHVHKKPDLINSIQKGMVSHASPLIVLITTAGYDKSEDSPAYQTYLYSKKILSGVMDDDGLFPMIFEMDEEDDWKDEKNWIKPNPNLGLSPKLEALQSEFNEAVNLGGAKEVDFKIKHLNMWVDSAVTWISQERWKEGQLTTWPKALDFIKAKEKLSDKSEVKGYGGLDLAAVFDFTSLCIEFVHKGTSYVFWRFYLPEATVKSHPNENYRIWAKAGHITVTPGNATDYNYIKRDIKEMCELGWLTAIYYDRFNSSQLVIDLTEEGIPMVQMGQGFTSMSSPVQDIERLVLESKLQHCNNPVAAWMLSNVRLKYNENNDVKITKKDSNGKVDGMVALAMSRRAHMDNQNTFVEQPTIWIL